MPVVEEERCAEHITVVEMTKKIGRDLGGLKWIVMKEVKADGIKTMSETAVKEICV